jgi:hypothetical protein
MRRALAWPLAFGLALSYGCATSAATGSDADAAGNESCAAVAYVKDRSDRFSALPQRVCTVSVSR